MERSKGCILIVDDDPLVMMNHSDLLEDNGFQVFSASTLSQGWRTLQARTFDAVVCDHDMVDGKGYELIRKMIAGGMKTPVIYLSAAAAALLDEVKTLSIVRKTLAKPVSEKTLVESVTELTDGGTVSEKYQELVANSEKRLIVDAITAINSGVPLNAERKY